MNIASLYCKVCASERPHTVRIRFVNIIHLKQKAHGKNSSIEKEYDTTVLL
jgi:hypothetical protein